MLGLGRGRLAVSQKHTLIRLSLIGMLIKPSVLAILCVRGSCNSLRTCTSRSSTSLTLMSACDVEEPFYAIFRFVFYVTNPNF